MKQAIWKFETSFESKFSLQMPKGSEILSVQQDQKTMIPCIWALVYPENEKEANYLRQEYFERCTLIKEKNNLNISDEQIKSLININFPDLRSVFNTLQRSGKIA